MAKAYASAIINAPIDAVWTAIRDFNSLPDWHPAIRSSEIEDGQPADRIGAVRSFYLQDGAHVRERLVALDDTGHALAYTFVTPAFPVDNYIARMKLSPVSEDGSTFAEWSAEFDEKPKDAGKYEDIISNGVFAAGWKALRSHLESR